MNAIFPSSRPNISVRVIPKIPATLVGSGGIGISKENGVWTIEPSWDDLQLIAPGVLLDPSTKEIWVHDPVTDVYNRMTLAGLGQALWWGTSITANLIGAGSKTFTTQSGKDWLPGMFVQTFSNSVITNYMIGQVTAYTGTTLTVNVLATGGSGTPSDWTIVPSTLPGAGAPGADGTSGGLNYRFVAGLSGDPGSGNVGFNSATIAAITSLRISKTDRNAVNLAAELATWDDSTTAANRGKVRVYSPGNPANFVIASINGPLVDGGAFITYPLTGPVGTTLPTVANCQVEFYRTGDQGAQGIPGTNGTNGTNGIDGAGGARYAWDTDTAATDPTAGRVKVNNATPASATALYLSETTALAQNIAALINSFDDNGSTLNRGTLSIVSLSDPTHFIVYRVTGTIVDNGAWVTIPVTGISAGVGLALNEVAHITFARTGDTGAAGAGTGDMIGSNNLIECTDDATARLNIGAAGTASPAFTGTPTAPTAAVGTSTTQIATTAFVDAEAVAKAGDTMSGALIVTPKGSTFGSAAGPTASSPQANTDANILLYNNSAVNWAGIGIDGGGAMWFRTGLSGSPAPAFYVNTDQAVIFSKASGYTEAALIYAASVAWDVLVNPVCTLLLAGNATMAAPTNVVTGRVYTIRIQQNAASTVAWTAANYKFAGGVVPAITATAGAVDRFTFIGRAGNVLEEIGRAQGIA